MLDCKLLKIIVLTQTLEHPPSQQCNLHISFNERCVSSVNVFKNICFCE